MSAAEIVTRPILLQPAMVRAVLAGTKTQTRRVCRSQPYVNGYHFDGREILCHSDYLPPSTMLMDGKVLGERYTTSEHEGWESLNPYGMPGDFLWVREGWRVGKPHDARSPSEVVARIGEVGNRLNAHPHGAGVTVLYEAGGWRSVAPPGREGDPIYPDDQPMPDWAGKRRPSIHMPRLFSRITLEITGVRVERLQDISDADANAEGVQTLQANDLGATVPYYRSMFAPRELFRMLWESINGAGSWDLNPYLWVVTFKRVPS